MNEGETDVTKRSVIKKRYRPQLRRVEVEDMPTVELQFASGVLPVYKMSVRGLEKIVALLGPYIDEAFANIIASGLGETDASKIAQKVESTFGPIVRNMLAKLIREVPSVVRKAFCYAVNVFEDDEELWEWVQEEVSPIELLEVIPKLDELNNFGRIAELVVTNIGYFRDRYSVTVQEKEAD